MSLKYIVEVLEAVAEDDCKDTPDDAVEYALSYAKEMLKFKKGNSFIVYEDFEILNPYKSECGRFIVDPNQYYNLSLRDLSDHFEANVKCPNYCPKCEDKGYIINPEYDDQDFHSEDPEDDEQYIIRCDECLQYGSDKEAELAEENDRTNWGGRG